MTPEIATSIPSDERSFKDQLRDLVSTQIVPLHLLKSLLADPEKLPQAPLNPNDPLYDLITNRIELYAKVLSMIMLGGSVPVATLLCGIGRMELVDWRTQGLKDISAKLDTYYSRFVNDLNVAVLVPTIDAETVIHRKDPLEWLRSGPGRWVHPEGTWQAPTTKVAISPPEPTVGIAEETPNQVEENQLLLDAPSVQDLPAALEVLKSVGLGHVIEEAKSKGTGSLQGEEEGNEPSIKGD